MARRGSLPKNKKGSGLSQLSEEQLTRLRENTPFTENEIIKFLKRYAAYDKSEKGTDGVPFDTVVNFPEFIGHPFFPKILELFVDIADRRIYPEKFLYLLSVFSSKGTLAGKKKVLFKSLDVLEDGRLDYEEVFKLYKCLFDRALSDDQILKLMFQCLHGLDLQQTGQIHKEEFQKLIPDGEILQRMTIDLQV